MPDADMPFALFCGKVNWLSPRPGTAVDGFSELKAEWSTRYIGTDNAEIADVTSVIFVDGGDVARVGALRLAADRWPTIEIIGTPQTEAQVSTLARELGIALRSDAVPRTGSSEQHFPNPGQSDYLLVQSRGHQSFAPRFGDSQSDPMRAAPDLKTPNKQATVDLFGSINAPDLPMAPLPTVSATAAAEPSTDPDELYFAQLLALHAAKKGRGR